MIKIQNNTKYNTYMGKKESMNSLTMKLVLVATRTIFDMQSHFLITVQKEFLLATEIKNLCNIYVKNCKQAADKIVNIIRNILAL